MTHFSKGKWLAFKNDQVLEEEKTMMEDHLYTCDTCMDIYLKLIDKEELDFAEMIISRDFTNSVMKSIEAIAPIKKINKKKKKMVENIFMYYVAAASVVLVLTAGGVFTRIIEFPMEKINVDRFQTQESIGNIYSFSEKITNSTNSFINNFEKRQEGGRKDEEKK